MEKFFAGQVARLISTVRSGCDSEIEEVVNFCRDWGGGPLAAEAQVAEAWLAERQQWMQWEPAESAELHHNVELNHNVELGQLQLPVAPTEPPRPSQLYLEWMRKQSAASGL